MPDACTPTPEQMMAEGDDEYPLPLEGEVIGSYLGKPVRRLVCVPPVVPHQFQQGVCVWCNMTAAPEGDDE